MLQWYKGATAIKCSIYPLCTFAPSTLPFTLQHYELQTLCHLINTNKFQEPC